MALAKIILRKQQKVVEQYAQRYIVFGNVAFNLILLLPENILIVPSSVIIRTHGWRMGR